METVKQMDYKTILNENDLYKILGVNNNADLKEISDKYKDFAKTLHPDRHINKSPEEKKEIEEVFTKITSAFNVLKDTEQRKKYDYELDLKKIMMNATNIVDPKFNNSKPSINTSIFTDSNIDPKEIKRKKAESSFESAMQKLGAGQLDAAISDLRSAIDLNGNVAKYHSQLGLAMVQKGWNGYAQAEFKVALVLDPEDKIAKQNYVPSNNTSINSAKKNEQSGIMSKVKNLFKK